MLGAALLRSALSSISAVFGGLGVFFLWCSFGNPDVGGYALMFLGTATAIVFASRQ